MSFPQGKEAVNGQDQKHGIWIRQHAETTATGIFARFGLAVQHPDNLLFKYRCSIPICSELLPNAS